MWPKVISLVVVALVPPFVLADAVPGDLMSDSFVAAFCLCSGLSWCALFGLTFAYSRGNDRWKLLLLLPLVLFAFCFPVIPLFLWVAVQWAVLHGVAPP